MNLNEYWAFKNQLTDYVKTNSFIDLSLYGKYDVKRGLRNSNGTGVLVGVTSVSDVEGYKIINGEKIPTEGKLYYRGISLADLIKSYEKENRAGYEEVIFLLLFGKLPTEYELECFNKSLHEHMNFPKAYVEDIILNTPSEDVMNKLMRTLLALYSYDDNPDDISVSNVLDQSLNLIAKMPMMIAYAYQAYKHYFHGKSLVLHRPLENAGIAENFLHLVRDDSEYTHEEVRLLDTLLITHADHGGGNNSAFATHVVSSTGTDTYSAITTAIGSLKGPKHGGANLMVVNMIDDLKEKVSEPRTKEKIHEYVQGILRKENFNKTGLVYGMGHAVYTLSDPRADLLKSQAKELAETKGYMDDFMILHHIEESTKELLAERGVQVCANVDLYSGLVYSMLGIEENLYTPLFALARLAGWCAHRLEQIQDDRIMRPAYVTKIEPREYIDLKDRVE